MNGAFEIKDLVDANSYGGVARSVRSQIKLGRAFLDAIYVVPEFFAVIDAGDVVPGAERMQRLAVQQGLALASRLIEAVEAPLIVDDADLKEHPIVGVSAGGGILLAEVKPSLLRL